MDWKNICKMMSHADRQNEMAYQKYIKEMILDIGLGWSPNQITEQLSLQLGSTERIVPDMLVRKDERNRFIVEVKKPGHVKAKGDIEQLLSYMKQLEVPVGMYWGDEIEVYWKTFGDGSTPLLLLKLDFNDDCKDGSAFVELFSEGHFSLDAVREFKEERMAKAIFETKVNELMAEVTASSFQLKVEDLVRSYLLEKEFGKDVVDAVMDKVSISILSNQVESETGEETSSINDGRVMTTIRANKGTAQRYAYGLIRQIIDKNPGLSFEQLFAIFRRKNRIEKISEIKDTTRWFLAEDDIITLSDGTKVAVSNQWGFNNHSKPNMDNLRSVAERFGIDTSLPE